MKLLFLDLQNSLIYSKLVKIKYHQLELIKTVKPIDNYIGYGSVIERNDAIDIIYSSWTKKNVYAHDAELHLISSQDGVNFIDQQPTSLVLPAGDQLGSHSCTIYDSRLEKFLMIGGVHILTANKFERICNLGKGGHNVDCLESAVFSRRYQRFRIQSNQNRQQCRSNGMYLMESTDLENWSGFNQSDLPLNLRIPIHRYKQAINSRSPQFSLDLYDNQPTLVYNPTNETYFLYTRNNHKVGVRLVECYKSTNLSKWIGPYDIKLNRSSNCYCLKVKYDSDLNCYLGFGHTIKYIFLCYSYNGINWKYVSSILNETEIQKSHPTNYLHQGSPVISKDGKSHLFYLSRQNEHLDIYKLRLDGYSCLTSIDQEGEVLTKLLVLSSGQIKINYRITNQEGYIKCMLLDKNKLPISGYNFARFDLLGGELDEIQRVISWNDQPIIENHLEVHLKIKMKHAEIYGIYF